MRIERRTLFKSAAALSLTAMLGAGGYYAAQYDYIPKETRAMFHDVMGLNALSFSAGTLDISLKNGTFFEVSSDIQEGRREIPVEGNRLKMPMAQQDKLEVENKFVIDLEGTNMSGKLTVKPGEFNPNETVANAVSEATYTLIDPSGNIVAENKPLTETFEMGNLKPGAFDGKKEWTLKTNIAFGDYEDSVSERILPAVTYHLTLKQEAA